MHQHHIFFPEKSLLMSVSHVWTACTASCYSCELIFPSDTICPAATRIKWPQRCSKHLTASSHTVNSASSLENFPCHLQVWLKYLNNLSQLSKWLQVTKHLRWLNLNSSRRETNRQSAWMRCKARWFIENKWYLCFLFSVRISFNTDLKIWYSLLSKNSSGTKQNQNTETGTNRQM